MCLKSFNERFCNARKSEDFQLSYLKKIRFPTCLLPIKHLSSVVEFTISSFLCLTLPHLLQRAHPHLLTEILTTSQLGIIFRAARFPASVLPSGQGIHGKYVEGGERRYTAASAPAILDHGVLVSAVPWILTPSHFTSSSTRTNSLSRRHSFTSPMLSTSHDRIRGIGFCAYAQNLSNATCHVIGSSRMAMVGLWPSLRREY